MRRATMAIAMVALWALAGCGGFTRAGYETIHVGDEMADVRAALGAPTETVADGVEGPADTWWVYDSQGPRFYRAIVRLRNGKVVGTSWYDAQRDCPPLPGE